MITESEFSVYQDQLIKLGQENSRLKEELDKLLKKNSDLPKLKSELEEWMLENKIMTEDEVQKAAETYTATHKRK